jgi:hypothetical protein
VPPAAAADEVREVNPTGAATATTAAANGASFPRVKAEPFKVEPFD